MGAAMSHNFYAKWRQELRKSKAKLSLAKPKVLTQEQKDISKAFWAYTRIHRIWLHNENWKEIIPSSFKEEGIIFQDLAQITRVEQILTGWYSSNPEDLTEIQRNTKPVHRSRNMILALALEIIKNDHRNMRAFHYVQIESLLLQAKHCNELARIKDIVSQIEFHHGEVGLM
jgi:hypothetical protein